MRVLITGAAGMLGRKLTQRLADLGALRAHPIERIDLVDLIEAPAVSALCAAHAADLTSYGTQKMVAEALLADYSRRGFLDGIGIRLPTISVRPGLPNAAASGFFSGIIRAYLEDDFAPS